MPPGARLRGYIVYVVGGGPLAEPLRRPVGEPPVDVGASPMSPLKNNVECVNRRHVLSTTTSIRGVCRIRSYAGRSERGSRAEARRRPGGKQGGHGGGTWRQRRGGPIAPCRPGHVCFICQGTCGVRTARNTRWCLRKQQNGSPREMPEWVAFAGGVGQRGCGEVSSAALRLSCVVGPAGGGSSGN